MCKHVFQKKKPEKQLSNEEKEHLCTLVYHFEALFDKKKTYIHNLDRKRKAQYMEGNSG